MTSRLGDRSQRATTAWRRSELLVSVVVDGHPIPKARARVCGKHAFTPARTKAYEELIGWTVRQKHPELQPDGEHAFMAHLVFYMPTHRRQDCDNLAKVCLDALNGIVWQDDSQVTDLRIQVFRGSEHPCLEILVWRLESA